MKKTDILFSMILGGFVLAGCSSNDNNNPPAPGPQPEQELQKVNDTIPHASTLAAEVDESELISAFVVNVVEPTYKAMCERNTALYEAVSRFCDYPTQDKLQACADAWLLAREPWEKSEAFLFGPVEDYNIDPNIDSWPLSVSDIKQKIASNDFDDLNDEASQEIKGYHTLEYLIFNEGAARIISTDTDYNSNPKGWANYMKAVARLLKEDTDTLYDLWFGNGEATYGGRFADLFTSGEYENPIGEIIEGMSGIAEEVGNSKIGGPYYTYEKDPQAAVLEVESWYSWHSRDDYMNNIRSIKHCYLGNRTTLNAGAEKNSISSLVCNQLGVARDNEVRDAINKAVNCINTITQPFRNNIHSAEAKAAMDACADLKEILDDIQAELGLN